MRVSCPPWLVAASLCLAAPLPGQSATRPQAIRIASRALPGPSVWTSLFDGGSVPFIPGPSTAYDGSRDRIVLYADACGITFPPDPTWEFDGHRWQQLLPPVSPPLRQGPALAYDAHRKRTVLFGGSGPRNDLWEWDGTTWTERVTALRPAPRFGHMMAYDEMRRCVVLFGGTMNGADRFDDTWTWDGTTWQEQMPATRPPARASAGMAYDPVRGRIVMFGGVAVSPAIELDDTWEWDGTDWTRVGTGEHPSRRSSPGLAYDPQRRQTILFGGFPGVFGFGFKDTWGFDGQRWMPLDAPGVGPLGRAAPGMVYDSKRGRIVMYGGSTFPFPGRNCFADVWTLDSPTPGVAGFGAGCPGGAGVPVMSLDLQAGGTLGLRLSPLSMSAGASAFFAFGASRQQWGGLSLPAPLSSLGFPLCSLWVGLDVIVPVLPQAGIAELALRVPGSVVLHAQGLALDAGGLSLSGAATVDTGLR